MNSETIKPISLTEELDYFDYEIDMDTEIRIYYNHLSDDYWSGGNLGGRWETENYVEVLGYSVIRDERAEYSDGLPKSFLASKLGEYLVDEP